MKKNVAPVYTDAAAELASVMEYLQNHRKDEGKAAWEVISDHITSGDHFEVLKIYSMINQRFYELIDFFKIVEDEYLDNDLKGVAIASLNSLQSAFKPQNFASPWKQVVNGSLLTQNIQSLKFLSRTVRAHRPFLKIDPEQVVVIIDALDEAHSEINATIDLPEWAQTALNRAIDDLDFVLRNIELCGQEEALGQLLKLHASAQAISASIDTEKLKQIKLERLAVIFILAVDLFTSAPNVAQALPVWNGWIGSLKSISVPLISPPLRQIEGPKEASKV